MLYILFGRDHIGKKSVRDYICNNYGLIIVPKYTDDKHKKWILYDYDAKNLSTEAFSLPEQIEFVRSQIKMNRALFICDQHDPYLRWLSKEDQQNIESYSYEITKIYNTDQYQARYFISIQDIDTALTDSRNNYCLVCASGVAIELIKQRAQNLNMNLNDVISVIHIEGDDLSLRSRASWKYIPSVQLEKVNDDVDIPAIYLFEKSQQFIGTIRNNFYKLPNGLIDFEKFSKNISLQWESITSLFPLHPKIFMVRPFRDASTNNESDNINDLVEQAIFRDIKKLDPENYFEFVKLNEHNHNSVASIFAAMDAAIRMSQIILVDLRGHRRNCYYEYGVAVGLYQAVFKSKQIFCLIGAEIKDGIYDYALSKEDKDKMYFDLLHDMELDKAYDVTLFPHYKYLCQKTYSRYQERSANVRYVMETSNDGDFIGDIKALIDKVYRANQFDVAYLAKRRY